MSHPEKPTQLFTVGGLDLAGNLFVFLFFTFFFPNRSIIYLFFNLVDIQ